MPKYSFSTAALFPRDSVDSLKLVGKAGFEYAELMPQCFADSSDAFAIRAERAGVKVGSVHYPLAMFSMLYNAYGGMCVETRDFGRKLVGLCSRLGASVLVIHPHEHVKEAQYRSILEDPIVENIVDLSEACEAAGVVLVVENSPNGPGATATGLLSYIAGFGGRAKLKPMVDTTEACEASQNPAEFIRDVQPFHLHLSDHAGEKKHIPAGEGEVDWKSVKASLKGYGGLYTLEPSYRWYLDDASQKLEKAHAFIQGLIEGE